MDAPVEIVTIRLRAIGNVDPPVLPFSPFVGPDSSKALLDYRRVGLEVDGLFKLDGYSILPV